MWTLFCILRTIYTMRTRYTLECKDHSPTSLGYALTSYPSLKLRWASLSLLSSHSLSRSANTSLKSSSFHSCRDKKTKIYCTATWVTAITSFEIYTLQQGVSRWVKYCLTSYLLTYLLHTYLLHTVAWNSIVTTNTMVGWQVGLVLGEKLRGSGFEYTSL